MSNFRHGSATGKPSPEYIAWTKLRYRCSNVNDKSYQNYGGRGIRVSPEWEGRRGFERFLAHMGPRPSKDHSVDRIDPNGDYEPQNCRWADRSQQANNKRTNIVLSFAGRRQTVAQWAAETGLKQSCIRARLQLGWPVDLALTRPSEQGRRLGDVR